MCTTGREQREVTDNKNNLNHQEDYADVVDGVLTPEDVDYSNYNYNK